MELRSAYPSAAILCVCIFSSLIPKVSIAADGVDPRLVGTWKLNYLGPPAFWVIREDGVYRIHGPHTPGSAHRGKIQATNGKWSIHSPKWQDSGTYELKDENTLVSVGKLGPGTWELVWTAGTAETGRPAPTPACGLLSLSEVARVLEAPVAGGKRQGGPDEGCRYTSSLDDQERVTLWMSHGSTINETYKRERKGAQSAIDLSGVGRAAYATISRNGILQIQVLGKEGFDESRMANMGTRFQLTLKLLPKATEEDLPSLANLAKLAFDRWGGKQPLRIKSRGKP